jgi:hypothetical protein
MASIASSNKFDFVSYLRSTCNRICLATLPTYFHQDNHSPGLPSLLRLSIIHINGSGILTWFPSTSLFSYALGAALPYVDQHCVGILGYSANKNLTYFTLLMSAFALLIPPANFSIHLHRLTERSPTIYIIYISATSVHSLAPLNLPCRPTRPVSYYAFFKGWLLLSQPPGCLCLPTSFPT